MNYKLAKQLKDAGFPKKYCKNFYATNNKGEEVLIPSLSELIEACGDRFFWLTKVIIKEGIFWQVGALNGNLGGIEKTPEEAVAKFWLKLTKE